MFSKDVFCDVCGKKIDLTPERHYIAREPMEIRGAFDFSSNMEPTLYDAIDCPFCGSQNILHERKWKYKGTEKVEEEVDSVENE